MKWKTWVFDCDGVLMNSNGVKKDAMYRSALDYGSENAKRLVEYHVSNGGVGREIKFRWFLREIMGISEGLEEAVSDLKREYSKNLWDGLLTCELSPRIHEILAGLRREGVSLFVVSGADQDELRELLRERQLASMFDGIYGAPDTKDEILSREIETGNIIQPAVFLGDSRYDHEASQRSRIDFVFVSEWSDFEGWEKHFNNRSCINIVNNISEFYLHGEKVRR